MALRRRVYLAGPDVFLPDAAARGARKVALCDAFGFAGLFPLEGPPPTRGKAGKPAVAPKSPPLECPHSSDEPSLSFQDDRASRAIYAANMGLIAAADFGIFNLTPFRGPSADVGTVFELGVFIGLGKPVFAYSNVDADLFARVAASMPLVRPDDDSPWRDGQGMSVEDFGNADNLMIDEALGLQGRTFHRAPIAADGLYTDLGGLEACLREAAAFFGPQQAFF